MIARPKKSLFCSIILAISFAITSLPASACSLALHDWKLVNFIKIPLTAPIFPAVELDTVSQKIKRGSTQKVFWISDHSIISKYSSLLTHYFPGWAGKLPWIPSAQSSSLFELANQEQNNSKPPVIIGSDNNYLKIAFFKDTNSNGNCYQLVIQQENRIRGVFPDTANPWAQEINGQAWLSLIFYKFPLPENTMSFSIFPINGVRKSVYEDHNYVEKLLAEKKLFRRPELKIDPFSQDFPELPK